MSFSATWQLDVSADEDDATATCDVVKQDGEVCGRERPCRYHDDTEET